MAVQGPRTPFGLVMAQILFPTSHGRSKLGEPARARACWCPVPWADHEDGCVRCGHWTEAAIRETWHAQARRMRSREPSPHDRVAPQGYRRQNGAERRLELVA